MEASPSPRRYATTSTDWEFHKLVIADLYVKQNLSLSHVMKIMEQKYGFFATASMYKKRITHWNLKKNLSKKEVAAMLSIQQTRREEGKQTDFFVGQRKVDLDKYLKRREPLTTLSSNLALPDIMQSEIIARTPSPDSSLRRLPATPQFSDDINSILTAYVRASFNSRRWSYTYNLNFVVTSMQDPSDFALNNSLRTFALVERILDSYPQESDMVLLLLRFAFDKLTLIVKNESPMLILFLLELCGYLNRRSDLATTILPRLYQLCENNLGSDHALMQILQKVPQNDFNDGHAIISTVHDILLNEIIPFVGPDNLLAIRLYFAAIWHSEGITGFSREKQPNRLILNYMQRGRTSIDFNRSKCALALGLCTSSFQNSSQIDTEQYLDTISSTFKLLETLVDYSQNFSVLLLANLNLNHESRGELSSLHNGSNRPSAHYTGPVAEKLERPPRRMSSVMSLSAILEPAHVAYSSMDDDTSSSVTSCRARQKFKVMVLCTLQLEADAILDVMDEFLDEGDEVLEVQTRSEDTHALYTGVIGGHNVVFVHMKTPNLTLTMGVVTDIQARFPDLNLVLEVGICGATPITTLGDVVCSNNVVQYKHNKHEEVEVQSKNTFEGLSGPSRVYGGAHAFVSFLETYDLQKELRCDIAELLQTTHDGLPDTKYPGLEKDRLYVSSYRHKHSEYRHNTKCKICSDGTDRVCKAALTMDCDRLGCEHTAFVIHNHGKVDRFWSGRHCPEIHFGRIASGDRLLRSGQERDHLAKTLNVLAFEMEGTRISQHLPIVMIKGVCDYADGHRTKVWRRYAATTAAAAMKVFLRTWDSEELHELKNGDG